MGAPPEGSFLWSALCIIPVFLQLRILWGWKLQNLTAVTWGFIFLIIPCPEGTVQGKNSRILIPLGFLLCAACAYLFMHADPLLFLHIWLHTCISGRKNGRTGKCVCVRVGVSCKRNQMWPLISYISLLKSHWLELYCTTNDSLKSTLFQPCREPGSARKEDAGGEWMLAHYRLCQCQAADGKISQQK